MSSGNNTSTSGKEAEIPRDNPLGPTAAAASQYAASVQPRVGGPAVMASPNPPKPPPVSTPRYQPQFTAATQMILKRMKGEPVSLSSAFSSSPLSVNPAVFEAAKSRLRETLNSASTPQPPKDRSPSLLRMPTPSPSTTMPRVSHPPHALSNPNHYLHKPQQPGRTGSSTGSARAVPVAHMSAIQKVNAGLTPSGKPRTEAKARPAPTVQAPIPTIKKTKIPATTKRKRAKDDDSDSDSDGSDAGAAAMPTMTKSGRHVTKPTTYNPAEMDDSHKRARGSHFGSRTAEQAMCRRCSRLAFNDDNQIVFCDGCEGAWHQMCHQPRIGAHALGDVNAKWYCADCAAKKEKNGSHKKVKVEQPATKTSWADRTNGQKRAYLSSLPSSNLVEILMGVLEQHPNLQIFPSGDGANTSNAANGNPRSFFGGSSTAGLFSRSDANPLSTLNYIRKISASAPGANTSGRSAGSRPSNGIPTQFEFTPFDPVNGDVSGLLDAWPKSGEASVYDKLVPDDICGVMEDDYDDEVVRHTVWKNGVAHRVGAASTSQGSG